MTILSPRILNIFSTLERSFKNGVKTFLLAGRSESLESSTLERCGGWNVWRCLKMRMIYLKDQQSEDYVGSAQGEQRHEVDQS